MALAFHAPLSSPRTQGPIITGVSGCTKALGKPLLKQATRRMGPCVRRDDDAANSALSTAGPRDWTKQRLSIVSSRPCLRAQLRSRRGPGVRRDGGEPENAFTAAGILYPATCLMRAINSSTALSTGT